MITIANHTDTITYNHIISSNMIRNGITRIDEFSHIMQQQ